jgi:hypothetical protein
MERGAEYLVVYRPEICSVEHCIHVAYAQELIWYDMI